MTGNTEVPSFKALGSEVESKVSLMENGTSVNWIVGDLVAVADGSGDVYKFASEGDGSSAIFRYQSEGEQECMFNKSAQKYLMAYPWTASVTMDMENNTVMSNLPAIQNAVKGNFEGAYALAVAVGNDIETPFAFKCAISMLKVEIPEALSGKVAELAVRGNQGEDLAGDLVITCTESGPVTELGVQKDSEVRLVSENGALEPGTYYIAINPSTYTEGLEFTFENGEAVYSIVSPANVEMTPGAVADMGTIGTLNFSAPEEPETPTTLEIGKAYAKDGVVFWINPDNSKKGKIISGAVANIAWGKSSKYAWIADINTDDGVANMQYVLNLEGSDASTYPAVYFCKNLGEGWRLPTINEMLDLIRVYYGVSSTVDDATLTNNYPADPSLASAVEFDAELAKCLVDDPDNAKIAISASSAWYWTGQGYIKDGDINSGKNARVKIASTVFLSGGGATNKAYVRCVRDVEIK